MSLRKHLRPLIPFPSRNQIRKWFPDFETRNLCHIMRQLNVDCVLDVGANRGQFRDRLRSGGYAGRIVSVEPASKEHEILRRRASGDAMWSIWKRSGIGATPAFMTLHIGRDTTLSSFLTHRDPRAQDGVELVEITTLDLFARDCVSPGSRVLAKIDVQGFEMAAIAGGQQTLAEACACFVELSLQRSYEGEGTYLDVLQALDRLDFVPVFFSPVLRRRKLGISHAADALFVKRAQIR